MKRYVGRIAGTAAGALAGPAGALFGLLVGWLVDQFRSATLPEREVRRFLRSPRSEKDEPRARLYTICALAVAALPDERVLTSSSLRPETVGLLSAGYASRSSALLPSAGADRRLAAATFDRCASLRRKIDVDTIVATVDTRRAHDLLENLIRLVDLECDTMSARSQETLCAVARGLSIDRAAVDRMTERALRLDDRSCRILGVDGRAREADVRAAFRLLVRQLHPDGAGALDDAQRRSLEEALVRIRDAHDLLLEQLRRRERTPIRRV